MKAAEVKKALGSRANPEKAAFYPRFFKTGKGEYGEGDRFVGVVVPDQRKIARSFRELPLAQVRILLASAYHEHRGTGLFILAEKVKRGDEATAESVFEFVLQHLDGINNWDLVDLAAPKLIGPRLIGRRDRMPMLDAFAADDDIWKRRIAVLATLAFIQQGDFRPTLKLCRRLLTDDHDLIHKATGWMLREIGNRDLASLLPFLDRHARRMPRTMLRYAIEKLPEGQRKSYLNLR